MSYHPPFSSTHGQSYTGWGQPIADYHPTASHSGNIQANTPTMIHPGVNAHHWYGSAASSSSSSTREYTIARSPGYPESPRTKAFDWGILKPGKIHQVSIDIAPSPQSIMDGTFQPTSPVNKKDIVIYVPRRADFCGLPSIPSILFSVNGKPGPYIRDVAKGKVLVDRPYDPIFFDRVWKQTWCMIEWPGTEHSMEAISCFNEKGEPITRANLAALICTRLCQFFIQAKNGKLQWGPQHIDQTSVDWDLSEIDYRDVRIMGLNYYRKTWIPVLAMDALYD